ncbi:helix-turn-helix domain-containing protein [Nocardia concava]|uniref:helix-turn-helix domain-containing protein n=1 Tax=Nocardia concava TaxID=257281 RepID=UPI0002E912B4|nr:helix-turn-helix transcriptional regulator [Nocardia concava]
MVNMLPIEAAINAATATTVRDAIAKTNRTEKSVAEGANITPSTWQRRIHGRTGFSIHELSRIAAVLGVKLSSVLDTIAEKLR